MMANPKAFSVALLIAVAGASFGMGRVSNLVTEDSFIAPAMEDTLVDKGLANIIAPAESQKIQPIVQNSETKVTAPIPVVESKKVYVGSKNGTKYHLPWCSGAKNIKEENKVWFSSKEEAESQGYTTASNCKGI